MMPLFKKAIKLVVAVCVFTLFFQLWKPFPANLMLEWPERRISGDDVEFLADLTYVDANGERKAAQEIWDEIFRTIDRADRFILLDMFLFNDFQGKTREEHRRLSTELTERLIAKREKDKHIVIVLITDPINAVYGGVRSAHLERLRANGVHVIETELGPLRDSNPLWSALWRPLFSWSGNDPDGGWLPHPFQNGGPKVTLRSWAALLNFKANHRKLIVADAPPRGPHEKPRVVTIVTSSNPHDASSMHGNVALKITGGDIWKDALTSERLVAELGGDDFPSPLLAGVENTDGTLHATFLTEARIRKRALRLIDGAMSGDAIDIAMFYLSDRKIVRALADAANRGVTIRLILDPNKDAFGWEKNGIPNRPVAKELVRRSGGDIAVRWCNTTGEQCHAKLMLGKTATSTFLMLGSANFTRRNIGDYNLEANIAVESDAEFRAWKDARNYFELLWNNKDGRTYTLDYAAYEDKTFWKGTVYKFMERTGLSSF